MLNYSFVKKNETKPDNMGNVENSSNLETVVVINCILNVPLIFTSITGNALVLVAIMRTPSLRSVPSTILLCSLAITDFLVGLIVQPVYIANELHHSTGGSLAKVKEFMSFFLCGVSLTTITAISVDRLLALHYHMAYPNLMTTKRALYASASLWFVSILLLCLKVWKSEVVFLIAGVYITICLVISSASYIKIYFIVRHHQIQIHDQQQALNSFNIGVNIPDSNNMIISKKHALKTFIYYICMICCYLPYLSYSLLRTTLVIGYDRNWSFVDTVVFLNSSVNPFLYCWCNREIRTSAVKVIRKMMCKQTEVASELEG
ncbi:histamine H2 receptor-like [Porites lutea]|uniref:histamine H2 receptor-like n=1 Tax=Porites lutea TaxID=51062 RepID=UPI003CC68EDB